MVKQASYQKALDRLECLLVARMFEMARLNVSGTGYKMRKHIAQSLKNCSKSIQNAIIAYNEAAAALSPPCRKITWDEIIDFSYLSETDILHDTHEDVCEKKWATPQNRLLMSRFFKYIRAEEEIARVHVEVKRLLTHMVDEEQEVCGKAKEVEVEDPALALQLRLYWTERSRYNQLHRSHLFAITKLRGFDLANRHYWTVGTHVTHQLKGSRASEDAAECPEDWEEEEEAEDDVHEFESRVAAVLDITFDDN
ncbi:hypothetical protein BT96DRAFT_840355 [Gymnopus androsaceus JB14]|uniref:Uncharacterized protein n=1 Tax=Gymnopus androsaceus JB14 TaxID=1447944 RepID=A0A6A4GK27_9AGAR|nr:hypothetical protein BT96DRAFT_840355 [Gymnopus androsaceus JB14]